MDHVSAALSEGLYPTESRTYAPLLKSRTEMYSVATISNNNGYYKPLDPVKHDIRLLVLWPEQYWNGDEPRCCLVHTSLTSEKPMYDALSYCWGDRSETRFVKMELTKDQYYSHDSTSVFDQYTSQYQPDEDFIFLNINQSERLRIWFDRLPDKGKFVTNFRVTINLYNALKHHRLSELRLFWVDAICINQDDKLERSHQVGYMREIYKSAMNVTVWLGGESGMIWEMQELATSVVEFLRSSESGNITMDEIFRSQQISTLSQD
jgi:Heterokaryon incompatibility protein (HET)